MRKIKDWIDKLIEISDDCMTMHGPIMLPNGKWKDRPCNCRANVKRLLKGVGIKMDRKGRIL